MLHGRKKGVDRIYIKVARIPWMVAWARWMPSGSLFTVDSNFLIKDSIACVLIYWWELVSKRGWMPTLTTRGAQNR